MQEKQQNSLILVIQDVTKKRNHNELQKRLKFQTQLLLSFSHELRTPLNSSIQLLQIAIDNVSPSIRNTLIRPAYNSNILLLSEINDILDYASFLTGTFHYSFSDFRLWEAIQETSDILQAAISHKKINFQVVVSEDIKKKVVRSDKQRIIQVLVALFMNSIKFTPLGGAIVLILKWTQPTNLFKFIIIDNGQGMNEDTLNVIQSYLKLSAKDFAVDFGDQKAKIGLGFKISNKIVSGLGDPMKTGRLKIKL